MWYTQGMTKTILNHIRQLFSKEGAESEKINLLAERRTGLSQRCDRIYDDIGQLEKQEAKLFEEGKAATSNIPRRRIAAQLNQIRKNIARQNATTSVLNKQIDVISSDIHNLTLIQQGQMAQLPETSELTVNAVRAEEMLEELQSDADMVGSLDVGVEESISDEELAIMEEFEEVTQEEELEPTYEDEDDEEKPIPTTAVQTREKLKQD